MIEVDPISQTLVSYTRIIKPYLGDKPLTESLLGEIEARPEIQEKFAAARVNPTLLREATEGVFLVKVQESLNSKSPEVSDEVHAAEVIDRISREYDFLHGLTCTLATNLKGNKPTEKAFLDSLKELISAEASNQKLRDTFANLSLDPDSPLTLQIVSGKINEQWHDFNEAIEEINRLAEQPDAIFTCGFNVASLLKKADRLYRYKAFTVDAYFEKKNEPMNRFFTNAFIVFKALEKGKVSDGLTEEEYRKNPSVLYYEQTSKGLEAAIGTLSLLLEQVGIKLDAQGAIRKTAQSLCNFQAGIDFVQEIKKAVELLKSCTDEQFQAIADKSLNEITQVCKLTEENQAVVRALFE